MEASLRRTTEWSFELKRSRIHGVGVFATHDIAKDVRLRLFLKSEKIRWFRQPETKPWPPLFRHCVPYGHEWLACPSDFGKMFIGWYLNHSNSPNAYHKNYVYHARRNIKAGDEITVNYRTLGHNWTL